MPFFLTSMRRPELNCFQRKQYFDFPSKLRRFVAGLRSPAYRVGFLLSAGYFKAAKGFFSPGTGLGIGVNAILTQLGNCLAEEGAFYIPAVC